MGEIDGYRYSFCVYGGHTYVVQLFLLDSTWRPPGVSEGYTGTPTPCLPAGCAIIPWVYPVGNGDTLFLFGRILRPSGICKSQCLAVRSGSVPDTPRPLSRVCTGPILNMVRRSPSVFNNQPRSTCMRRYMVWNIYPNIQIGLELTCYLHLTSDILDLYL